MFLFLRTRLGVGAIVRNPLGEILIWRQRISSFVSSIVELAKVIALYDGISTALDAGISPLWAETDSLILWRLLTGLEHFANEIQDFVDDIRDFKRRCVVHGFMFTNRHCNGGAHSKQVMLVYLGFLRF